MQGTAQISSHLLDICQNCETDFIWNYGTADLALVPLPCVCSHVVVVHLVRISITDEYLRVGYREMVKSVPIPLYCLVSLRAPSAFHKALI